MIGAFIHKYIYGRKRLQFFFEKLHFISLYGMNYGGASYHEDSGEKWVLNEIMRNNRDCIIIDAGANNGSYSLMAKKISKKYNCLLKIFLVEPNPIHLDGLNKIINENKGMFFFPVGLGRITALAKLNIAHHHTLSSFLKNDELYHNFKSSGYKEVQIIPLSVLIEQNQILSIDLLKIDVEGYEMEVLLGAIDYLRSGMIKKIQFEFGRAQMIAGNYLFDFFKILDNFSIHRVLKDGITGPLSYHPRLEIFQTTNYLAILK
jgi:FkbM family methyltransferase